MTMLHVIYYFGMFSALPFYVTVVSLLFWAKIK